MQVPPNACRGERSGFWGRRAPIQAVSLGLIVMGGIGSPQGPPLKYADAKGCCVRQVQQKGNQGKS